MVQPHCKSAPWGLEPGLGGTVSIGDMENPILGLIKSAQAFNVSLEAGLNFFDTAEVYASGKSEEFLGSFVEETPNPTGLVLASKFFPYPWRVYKGALKSALRRSLGRLKMQQLDLYQIHWPWKPRSIETWISTLADTANAGLTRAVGVSNYNKIQTEKAYEILKDREIPLASNQVEFHLLNQGAIRSGLLDRCQELGISIIAYSPIASGILSGKYAPENPPPGPRGRRYTSEYLTELYPLFDLMNEIGGGHGGKSYSQIAINWCICKGVIPIPGVKTPEQVLDNLGAVRLAADE